MSEVELLLNRARESLKAARIMVREELPNVVASRAYYTMFYIAEALLLKQGRVFKNHSAVIAGYGQDYALTKKVDLKLHGYLIAAFDARQVGEYGLENKVSSQEALQMINWEEESLHIAENFLRGEDTQNWS